MLTARDFAEFYGLIHTSREPFPWQQDLVDQVLATGQWPDLIDAPTGLGKTSVLDIAVFVAAATAGQAAGRPGRRRCFLVVDRRLVVDEATTHAKTLAQAVRAAETSGDTGVLGEVARALRSYAPDNTGELLPVTRMRGGVTWASSWLD